MSGIGFGALGARIIYLALAWVKRVQPLTWLKKLGMTSHEVAIASAIQPSEMMNHH